MAILLTVVVGYRALGTQIGKRVACAATFGANCAAGNGESFGKNALASGATEIGASGRTETPPSAAPVQHYVGPVSASTSGEPPGGNAGATGQPIPGHAGLPGDTFPPAGSPPPEPVTRPGEGPYYRNDTPIDAPVQLSEDNRPVDPSPGWEQARVAFLGDLTEKGRAITMMEGVVAYFGTVKDYDRAAELLGHWLYGHGEAVRIDARKMIEDLPSFDRAIQEQVRAGMTHRGAFDSGWKSASVADAMEQDIKTAGEDRRVLDWYYALNGYQYRIQGGGNETTVNGAQYREVKVQVFKRYNWGNPNGGVHRNDLQAGPFTVKQNTLAELNHYGMAHDFNVWGETTMLVPVNGQGPVIYR
ncbi:hypothetical protein [Pendulispora albinea]|uniref:Uncharacterized protein n=1 Tax=Pendulispora albinea TaxID=2741071 RepID=A0ABZ2M5M9_9BACT